MFRGIERSELAWLGGLFVAIALGLQWGGRGSSPHVVPDTTARHASQAITPGATGPGAAPVGAPEAAAAGPLDENGQIDVNKATAEELELLPGIGPSKAAAIVAERQRGGPFHSIADLERVHGIGEKTAQRLQPYLTLGEEPPAIGTRETGGSAEGAQSADGPVFVNRAGLDELQALKGVGPAIAARIVHDRGLHGAYQRAEDLTRVKGIGPQIVEKNRERMRFD